jgi:hypothetical protein
MAGRKIMKVYQYEAKTGVYEGETFEEAAMLQCEDGLTTIPPPDYAHGQVPVFDRQKNSWAVIPVSIARQLLHTGPPNSRESNA